MKRNITILLSFYLVVVLFISCDKDEAVAEDESNIVVDFSFRKTGSCYIETFAECESLPEGSEYKWYINGTYANGRKIGLSFFRGGIPIGNHTITLYVITPSGELPFITKEFEVFEDSIISEGVPIDTNSYNPMLDFTYSIRYSTDSSMAFIDMEDVSNYEHNSDVRRLWYVNGRSRDYRETQTATSGRLDYNGHYGILFAVTIDDVYYSLVKELYITGIK